MPSETTFSTWIDGSKDVWVQRGENVLFILSRADFIQPKKVGYALAALLNELGHVADAPGNEPEPTDAEKAALDVLAENVAAAQIRTFDEIESPEDCSIEYHFNDRDGLVRKEWIDVKYRVIAVDDGENNTVAGYPEVEILAVRTQSSGLMWTDQQIADEDDNLILAVQDHHFDYAS